MQPPTEPPSDLKRAIWTYAQSEKIKSALIWICQVAEQVACLEGPARPPALALLAALVRMVADEANLAGRISGERRWQEIEKKIQLALVMIRSGVPQETGFHLTQALVGVTSLGGEAAAQLQEEGLF